MSTSRPSSPSNNFNPIPGNGIDQGTTYGHDFMSGFKNFIGTQSPISIPVTQNSDAYGLGQGDAKTFLRGANDAFTAGSLKLPAFEWSFKDGATVASNAAKSLLDNIKTTFGNALPFNLPSINPPKINTAGVGEAAGQSILDGLRQSLQNAPPLELPGATLGNLAAGAMSLPAMFYAKVMGAASLVSLPTVGFHHFLEHKLMDKKLLKQKKMLSEVLDKSLNRLGKQGIIGLCGAAGIGGASLLISKKMSATQAKQAAKSELKIIEAKSKQAAAEAKAKIKQAKGEAEAAIRAEEGKAAARVKEISQKLEERTKDNIQPIKMDREYSFSEIFGQDEALKEADSFLLRVVNSVRLGQLEQGVPDSSFKPLLMTGPPGTGKTETVRAIVSMAQKENIKIDPYMINLNNVETDLAAQTIKTIRKITDENAAKGSQTLWFMDEFDSIRNNPTLGNELLTLMDGIKPFNGIVIAATNRPELLTPATWSRFDEAPYQSATREVRKLILKSKLEQYKLSPQNESTMERLLDLTENSNGRDIKSLMKSVRKTCVDAMLRDPSIQLLPTGEIYCSPEQLETAAKKMQFKVALINSAAFTHDNILRRKTAQTA